VVDLTGARKWGQTCFEHVDNLGRIAFRRRPAFSSHLFISITTVLTFDLHVRTISAVEEPSPNSPSNRRSLKS